MPVIVVLAPKSKREEMERAATPVMPTPVKEEVLVTMFKVPPPPAMFVEVMLTPLRLREPENESPPPKVEIVTEVNVAPGAERLPPPLIVTPVIELAEVKLKVEVMLNVEVEDPVIDPPFTVTASIVRVTPLATVIGTEVVVPKLTVLRVVAPETAKVPGPSTVVGPVIVVPLTVSTAPALMVIVEIVVIATPLKVQEFATVIEPGPCMLPPFTVTVPIERVLAKDKVPLLVIVVVPGITTEVRVKVIPVTVILATDTVELLIDIGLVLKIKVPVPVIVPPVSVPPFTVTVPVTDRVPTTERVPPVIAVREDMVTVSVVKVNVEAMVMVATETIERLIEELAVKAKVPDPVTAPPVMEQPVFTVMVPVRERVPELSMMVFVKEPPETVKVTPELTIIEES